MTAAPSGTPAEAAVQTAEHSASDAPTLVVPEGWVVDEVTRERLQRQLLLAPAGVVGVLAESGALPPGASFRVHAERLACAPLSVAVERRVGPARGVALLRPGVEFEVRDSVVEVDHGELLVDPGAHAHDPWQHPGPLLSASPEGRPPFPCRPVVVLLGVDMDEENDDWARSLVNGLVRNEVEGRVALPEMAGGLHLTRPCLPDHESLRALAPDVVVTLDAAAGEMVAAASPAVRSLVVIESLPDIAATSELVSWRRGRTAGRVRARIGPRIDAATLADLARRLCAGPHPLVPSEAEEGPIRTWTPGVEVRGSRSARAAARTLTVIAGDDYMTARVNGLVEHVAACGVAVDVVPVGPEATESAQSADLVLLDAAARSDAAFELLASGFGNAARTVVDLSVRDLVHDAAQPGLTPNTARFVEAADAVTSAVPAVHTAARRVSGRAQLVPTLLTDQRASELREIRRSRERWTHPVLAWSVGSAGRSGGARDAVAASLLEILRTRPDLTVEVVGEHEIVPRDVLAHDRVTSAADRDPDRLAGWTVHVWTPRSVDDEIADDALPLFEASYAGVPTVLAARLRSSIEGYMSRELLVEEDEAPSSWSQRLRSLLQDKYRWDRRSAEAAQRADALYGPAASEAVANRFLGWMPYEGS